MLVKSSSLIYCSLTLEDAINNHLCDEKFEENDILYVLKTFLKEFKNDVVCAGPRDILKVVDKYGSIFFVVNFKVRDTFIFEELK